MNRKKMSQQQNNQCQVNLRRGSPSVEVSDKIKHLKTSGKVVLKIKYNFHHQRHRGDGVIVARRRLYRNVARRRIAGVCAGIADYFGVETWVTRCAAVVGLIFMGQVTLPAYLVAWVVMERAPVPGEPPRRRRRGGAEGVAAANGVEAGFSARRRLKALLADAAELELRLRRMETHVTSGQYALQRELRDIEES